MASGDRPSATNEASRHLITAREKFSRAVIRPEMAAVAGSVLVFLCFTLTAGQFLTKETWINVTSVAAELGILGIGVTLLMIGGQFDLSVGAIVGLSSYTTAYVATDLAMPPLFAVLCGLAVGALLGTLNGVVQVKTGLHSFIVTLASMLIFRGVLTARTSGFPTSVELPGSLTNVIVGRELFGYRMSLLWLLAFAALGTLLLLRTKFGNWVFATGQNATAARNLGVPTRRVTLSLFAISGFCAGSVGVIQVARFGTVDALQGDGTELYAIAIAVIGGTLLTGGFGSVIGTVFGALLFGMVQVGLVVSGVAGYYFRTLVGIGLLLAVLLSREVTRQLVKSRGDIQQAEPDDEAEAEPDLVRRPRLSARAQGDNA